MSQDYVVAETRAKFGLETYANPSARFVFALDTMKDVLLAGLGGDVNVNGKTSFRRATPKHVKTSPVYLACAMIDPRYRLLSWTVGDEPASDVEAGHIEAAKGIIKRIVRESIEGSSLCCS
jgi:hypothetical protein